MIKLAVKGLLDLWCYQDNVSPNMSAVELSSGYYAAGTCNEAGYNRVAFKMMAPFNKPFHSGGLKFTPATNVWTI